MLDMTTPYLDMCMNTLTRKYSKTPTKIHRVTCPLCDRKLVTLYRTETKEYICKQCVDTLAANEVE